MPNDFIIRPATLSDAEQLASFQVTMAFESEGFRLDRETVLRGIRSFIERPQDGVYYLILDDKTPVGCGMVQHEWSDWRARRVLWLHSVFVAPEYRRLGCFRQFYAFLQQRVHQEPDLAGIRLYVDKTNERAEAAYRKLGMHDQHYKLFEWLP